MKHLILVILLIASCYPDNGAKPDPLCDKNIANSKQYIMSEARKTTLYPEVVVVRCYNSECEKCRSFCSGVIIGPQTVITASHCITCKNRSTFVEINKDIQIEFDVVAIDYHVDIAIGHLKTPTTIEPATLNYSPPEKDDDVLLLGYGDSVPPITLDNNEKKYGCSEIYDVSEREFSFDRYDNQSTLCSGDSGGGGYIDGLLAGIHTSSSYMFHLISSQISSKAACGDQHYSYDTRIDAHIDWISKHSKDKLKLGQIKR